MNEKLLPIVEEEPPCKTIARRGRTNFSEFGYAPKLLTFKQGINHKDGPARRNGKV